jgi:hypothetical protein
VFTAFHMVLVFGGMAYTPEAFLYPAPIILQNDWEPTSALATVPSVPPTTMAT